MLHNLHNLCNQFYMVQIVLTLNAFLDVMSSGGHWYTPQCAIRLLIRGAVLGSLRAYVSVTQNNF